MLITTSISFSVKCLFKSFARFGRRGLSGFYHLVLRKNSLEFWIQVFYQIHDLQIFSHSMVCLFYFLNGFFSKAKLFNVDKGQFINIFILLVMLFMSYIRNPFLTQGLKDFSPVRKCLSYFFFFFLAYQYPVVVVSFVEKTILSSTELPWHFCWKSMNYKCLVLPLDSPLFHWCIYLSLCRCHTILTTDHDRHGQRLNVKKIFLGKNEVGAFTLPVLRPTVTPQ